MLLWPKPIGSKRRLHSADRSRDSKMIWNLPLTVFCHVFIDWVQISDITRLDSACCNSHNRKALLLSLSSSQFVFKNKVNASCETLILWLLARNIRISDTIANFVSQTQPIANYLRKFGASIRNLEFSSENMTEIMLLFAIHCRNLKSVRFCTRSLDPSFKELLWCNPRLEELYFHFTAEDKDMPTLDGIILHSLKILTVRCNTKPKITWSAGIFGDSLQRLRLDKVDEEQLYTILKVCGGLKCLQLTYQRLSDDVLRRVVSLRPSLLHLDITGNGMITDDGILSIAKSFKSLQSISILDCIMLTDLSIKHLAVHCGNTLEILYCSTTSSDAAELKGIVGKFAALKSMEIWSYDEILCTSGATFALIQACPQLRTLTVGTEESICQSSRDFIRLIRPELKIEISGPATNFNVMSIPL